MFKRLKKIIKTRLGNLILSAINDNKPQIVDSMSRFYTRNQLFYDTANFVVFNQIYGDYLEFGVYKGDGLFQAYQSLFRHWKDFEEYTRRSGNEYDPNFWREKRFFAFDSFAGLPETTSIDRPIHFKGGAYKASVASFVETLQAKDIDLSKVSIVPGWFDEVLTDSLKKDHNLTKACLIFIDCDLYDSSVPVFKFISDLVQDGTVIIIDDYFRYKGNPERGIQKAFKEWLVESPAIEVSELTRCNANRVAFVCHKTSDYR